MSSTAAIQLLRITHGVILHQSLCAAANLGIADLLKNGGRTCSELAAVLSADEDALYRVLRLLSGEGVFLEAPMHRFENTPLSDLLRADVPGSLRPLLVFRDSPEYVLSLSGLADRIRNGLPTSGQGLETSIFERLRDEPRKARIFDDAMTAITAIWAHDIATAYDFGRWESVIDLGGGSGLLLAAILKVHSGVRGVLADRPEVLRRARGRGLLDGEIAARVQFAATDFFNAVPRGCRCFLMKNILHDWDDDRARQILVNCRRAIPDDGVLLIVEYCLGRENEPSLGKSVDLAMMAVTGGRERTVSEHRELLASAGFRLKHVIPIGCDIMMLESEPL